MVRGLLVFQCGRIVVRFSGGQLGCVGGIETDIDDLVFGARDQIHFVDQVAGRR